MQKKVLKKNWNLDLDETSKERFNLIWCVLRYKSEMEFDGKDFNTDKVKLYESMRQKIAKIYDHELPKFINCSLILNI